MYTFELPSGNEIELREMTGAEEELLTNQRLIRSGDAVNQVLANCILRIGENDEVGTERCARYALRRQAVHPGAASPGVAWR